MPPDALNPTPSPNPWLIAIAVMSGTFMEVLDTTVVNVSLPHIAGNLSASNDEATWTLTSYLVANAIILPMTGWLANNFGRKRLLMGSVMGFTVASFLCGLAPSLPFLIVCRVIQGACGGGLQPLSQAILLEAFPPEKRGQAMAFWALGIVVAPMLGPVAGGWLNRWRCRLPAMPGRSSDRGGVQGVAGVEVAAAVTGGEPRLALRAGAVGPGLGVDLALGLLLDPVVAHGRRRGQRGLDVLLGQRLKERVALRVLGLGGVLRPDAGQAVGHQLHPDRAALGALGVGLRCVENPEQVNGFRAAYDSILATAKHTVATPGYRLPVAGLDWRIVTSAGKAIAAPLPGAGGSNAAACANFERKPPSERPDDNGQSVGSVITFGRFRALDLGDLLWNVDYDLVCPRNKIGVVDLYLVTHHGQPNSGSPQLINAVRPRVAVMQNGTTKGGAPATFQTLHASPGLEDIWTLHWSYAAGVEQNSPGAFIANLDSAATIASVLTAAPGTRVAGTNPAHSPAYYIKISARPDGSFTSSTQRVAARAPGSRNVERLLKHNSIDR